MKNSKKVVKKIFGSLFFGKSAARNFTKGRNLLGCSITIGEVRKKRDFGRVREGKSRRDEEFFWKNLKNFVKKGSKYELKGAVATFGRENFEKK